MWYFAYPVSRFLQNKSNATSSTRDLELSISSFIILTMIYSIYKHIIYFCKILCIFFKQYLIAYLYKLYITTQVKIGVYVIDRRLTLTILVIVYYILCNVMISGVICEESSVSTVTEELKNKNPASLSEDQVKTVYSRSYIISIILILFLPVFCIFNCFFNFVNIFALFFPEIPDSSVVSPSLSFATILPADPMVPHDPFVRAREPSPRDFPIENYSMQEDFLYHFEERGDAYILEQLVHLTKKNVPDSYYKMNLNDRDLGRILVPFFNNNANIQGLFFDLELAENNVFLSSGSSICFYIDHVLSNPEEFPLDSLTKKYYSHIATCLTVCSMARCRNNIAVLRDRDLYASIFEGYNLQ